MHASTVAVIAHVWTGVGTLADTFDPATSEEQQFATTEKQPFLQQRWMHDASGRHLWRTLLSEPICQNDVENPIVGFLIRAAYSTMSPKMSRSTPGRQHSPIGQVLAVDTFRTMSNLSAQCKPTLHI